MTEDVDSKSSIGVVGAGIQGVCASLNLIKKGFKVTIIDRDEPGKDSASYGNAGHFSPYASLSLNRPDILIDVPSMLLSTTGPLALKWNYVHKMIPWFLQFIKNGTSATIVLSLFSIWSWFKFNPHILFKTIIVVAAFELPPPRPAPIGIFF